MPQLEKMAANFDGLTLKRPDRNFDIPTKEGVAVVNETIEYIKNYKPDPAHPDLEWSEELWKAARDHALDIGPNSLMSHTGSDGSSITERIERYCKILSSWGENIAYGFDNALNVLIFLIIDDGIPCRGHRENIFNRTFRFHGCFTASHNFFRISTVLDFLGAKYAL